MTAAIAIILAIALCVACWFLFDTSCDLAVAESKLDARQRVIDDLRTSLSAATQDIAAMGGALSESERIRHEIAASAMHGVPDVVVRWPAGVLHANADERHHRVVMGGILHYFTDEQCSVAAKRGADFPVLHHAETETA